MWLFDSSRESKLKFALLRCQKPGNQECKLQFATEPEYFTGIIKEPIMFQNFYVNVQKTPIITATL